MSFCFHTFNHPSNVNCCENKKTSKKKIPLLKTSSLDLDRSFKFPLSVVRSNGIGIIGGISVDSSLSFANKLINNNNNSPPHFVLCSDPTLSKELLSMERNYFAARNEKSSSNSFDHSLIVEKIRRKRMVLEESGVCCCVVMPCHLLHSWYDEIGQGCRVRFLHVGECVAKELKEAELRPVEAGSPIRIGVLATNENLVARFYKEKLQNESSFGQPALSQLMTYSGFKLKNGFEVILPDKATTEHIVIPALEALNRKDFEGAHNLFRIALQLLLVRAVNKIILASDDLRQLLPPDDPLWRKCIDPMDALARSSIEYAQSLGGSK
ncbi:hypothetical protein OROMI_004054 [Orobanche minor]